MEVAAEVVRLALALEVDACVAVLVVPPLALMADVAEVDPVALVAVVEPLLAVEVELLVDN